MSEYGDCIDTGNLELAYLPRAFSGSKITRVSENEKIIVGTNEIVLDSDNFIITVL